MHRQLNLRLLLLVAAATASLLIATSLAYPTTRVWLNNESGTNMTLVYAQVPYGCNFTVPPPKFFTNGIFSATFEVSCGPEALAFAYKVVYLPDLPNLNPLASCVSFGAFQGLVSPWCLSEFEDCKASIPSGYLARRPMCQLEPKSECYFVNPYELWQTVSGRCDYTAAN